jgi:glycerol-3-phosphate dehydrogenase
LRAHHEGGSRLERAATEVFDLVVIGAGALGSALAWEAASRGLGVALLEQDDFGCGASANSLKVVHGGLRYLQRLDVARARASAAERSAFLRIAPHLVAPLACVMPTRRSLSRGRMALAAGLVMNALLTADRNRGLAAGRRLPAGGLIGLRELAELAPGLNLDGATGAARWFDAQMLDSERLVLSFALGAEQLGACLLNHHRADGISVSDGRIAGVEVRNVLTGEEGMIRAAIVADCRAGWAAREGAIQGPSQVTGFLKAINLVLPDAGLSCAVGFPMRDDAGRAVPGRMLFAAPWNGVTLVGTWYERDPRGPGSAVEPQQLESMLQRVNASFGDWQFAPQDLRAVHIGYMPEMPGIRASDQDLIPADRPVCAPARQSGGPEGLWHLQTEKWTTVRRLAQGFLDRLSAEGALHLAPSRTRDLHLPGGDPESLAAAEAVLRSAPITPQAARRLLQAYGGRAPEVLAGVSAGGETEQLPDSGGILRAEVLFAVRREHARTLADLVRRTGVGAAGRPSRRLLEAVAASASDLLGWDSRQQALQVEEVLAWPMYATGLEGDATLFPEKGSVPFRSLSS